MVQDLCRGWPQTLDWGVCNSRLAWCVDFWGILTEVSRTRLIALADDLCSFRSSQAATLLEFRVPLTNYFVGRWFSVRSLRYTVTIDSVLANSKTQNAFLSPILAMFSHDCPPSGETCKYVMAPITQTNLGRFSMYWYAHFCWVYLVVALPSSKFQDEQSVRSTAEYENENRACPSDLWSE
jgi:hypothetical protein